jgi:hypothetical protein
VCALKSEWGDAKESNLEMLVSSMRVPRGESRRGLEREVLDSTGYQYRVGTMPKHPHRETGVREPLFSSFPLSGGEGKKGSRSGAQGECGEVRIRTSMLVGFGAWSHTPSGWERAEAGCFSALVNSQVVTKTIFPMLSENVPTLLTVLDLSSG